MDRKWHVASFRWRPVLILRAIKRRSTAIYSAFPMSFYIKLIKRWSGKTKYFYNTMLFQLPVIFIQKRKKKRRGSSFCLTAILMWRVVDVSQTAKKPRNKTKAKTARHSVCLCMCVLRQAICVNILRSYAFIS